MTLSKVAVASQGGSSYQSLLGQIKGHIQFSVEKIDEALLHREISAADLAVRSRRAYQWLKFLEEDQNLDAHLDSLQRINLFLPAVKTLPRYRRYQVDFLFYHIGSLYKIQGRSSSIEIAAQEGLITAPDSILIALLETALGKPSQINRKKIRDYTFTSAYKASRENLEYLAIPRGSFSRGSVHDLAESFKRVNRAYFNDEIPIPHLVWNNRLTFRKFGHYQWDIDTVMVSRTLDHSQVPEFVVDYVMYHELLHKKLGARQAKSRRLVHTGKFREEEAKFARLKQAQDFINKLSKTLA